jgi:hypothetical protein
MQEFQWFSVLGSALRMKPQDDSSSRSWKILFLEKGREKVNEGAFRGTKNQGWKLGFCNLFLLPESTVFSQVQTEVFWDHLSPFGTVWSLSFKKTP